MVEKGVLISGFTARVQPDHLLRSSTSYKGLQNLQTIVWGQLGSSYPRRSLDIVKGSVGRVGEPWLVVSRYICWSLSVGSEYMGEKQHVLDRSQKSI